MFLRKQILEGSGNESLFLWGARQTGKSTLLKSLFPDAIWFDLLLSDTYLRYKSEPQQFRQVILARDRKEIVVVDEIQKIPELLDEIHWLIVNHSIKFILSGSSPRKIIRSGHNLLGGRALRYELYPLIQSEIPDFDLLRALNNGLLPRHYLAENPKKLIDAYIGNYLKDEIMAEAKIRNINAFTQFLEAAAFSNGEMVNYSNIASECGVSHNTVKEYFQILEDTLLGRFVPSFQKKPKRRVILTSKFYYFDIGITNKLLKRGKIEARSESFGHAFEHFIYQELYAHSKYSEKDYVISYWRTTSQIEVDFILGDHEVALEIKGTNNIQPRHLKGLKNFAEEYSVRRLIVVSDDPLERRIGEISVIPWKQFLEQLWNNEII
ncbi:ATP-binding protein [Lunatibacter salilacus]|uniref:ATP-binding protein n=1 Tax=Lunatibacter salilacus TaxID=2483804 RepID=UPI00131B13E1|nr:AAA family ATPase [Lunatibacter salilacus]